MKLPRDVSGVALVKGLQKLGYIIVRQKGSHVRLTTMQNGIHHVTIPLHDTIKIGTLSTILNEVAEHHKLDRIALIQILFG